MKAINTFLIVLISISTFAQDAGKINKEFHDIVKSMPSPIEELEDLHNDKVKYDEHLLSLASNLERYQSDQAEAINCGIYLVDFAYLAVFEQQEKMMEYRHLAHELAYRADAAQKFDHLLSDNLEEKVKDYTPIKKDIMDAMRATEDMLLEKGRMTTATQMLLGTWVETQYIMLQTFTRDKKPSDEVKKHIMDQQIHLANLIKLMDEFKDEAGLYNEHEKLVQLETSFQKIHSLDEVNESIVMELVDEITRLRMDILAME